MKIYNFYLVIFLITNSFDEILSVDKIRPIFAEIFGKEWENGQMEENENIQISNWQNENELNSAVSIGTDQNNNQFDDEQKIEIVHKFHAIKEGIKKKRKHSPKIWSKIEQKIAEKLGISRPKIYKWKKEFGLSRKMITNETDYYETKKKEFVDRIDEFKRMYKNGKEKQFAEELGIGKTTLIKWKKEFGIEMSKSGNRFSNDEKMSKMNIFDEMKKGNPSLTGKEIAEFLKIGINTLIRWKKSKYF